jgi:hypothetical protein
MKNAVSLRHRSRMVLPLAGALMLLGFTGWAQEKAPGAPKATAGSQYALEIENGAIIQPPSLSGKPPTLKYILNVLRDKYPNANIVMSPGLADVSIADLKLRAISLPEELEALRVASGNKFAWESRASLGPQQNIDAATGLPVASAYVGLYSLTEPAPAPNNDRTVEAFNLTPYLGQHKDPNEMLPRLQQVEEIVSQTLKAISPPNTPPADFQFHGGANLLIVIGTREQLDTARKVINALLNRDGAGEDGKQTNLRDYEKAIENFEKTMRAFGGLESPSPQAPAPAPAPAAPPPMPAPAR